MQNWKKKNVNKESSFNGHLLHTKKRPHLKKKQHKKGCLDLILKVHSHQHVILFSFFSSSHMLSFSRVYSRSAMQSDAMDALAVTR